MTFFARAGKCPFFGANGLTSAPGPPPAARPPFRRDVRAMEPRPTAHSLKKCRRVWSRRGSWGVMTELFPCDELVEVEQDTPDHRPGGKLGDIRLAPGLRLGTRQAGRHEPPGFLRGRREGLPLLPQHPRQRLPLAGTGLPGQAEAEG